LFEIYNLMLLPVSEIHMLLQQTEMIDVLSQHSPESTEEYRELGRKCIVSRLRGQPAETGYRCVSLPTGMGMSHLVNQPREEKSVLVSDVCCKVSITNIRLVTRRYVAMVIYPTDRTDGGEGVEGGVSTEIYVYYLGKIAWDKPEP
jgi:hypothetical protein